MKEFTNEGRTFRYDYNELTVEQAELAREAGEFKFNQLQSDPESFRQLLKSRGAEWLAIVMSYLLREVKNNTLVGFNKDKAESEVEAFVKKLPVVELESLKECVSDFFSNIGKRQVISAILQGEKKKSASEMLLPILQMTMLGNSNKSA